MKARRLVQLAWRESRHQRGQLLFGALAIVFGVAVLTGLIILKETLSGEIINQSREILGGDLALTVRRSPDTETESFLASLPGKRAQSVQLNSMLSFSSDASLRLVQLRGISAEFPLIGELRIDPPSALEELRRGGGIVVDRTLSTRFNLAKGQLVSIGGSQFKILGELIAVPGEVGGFGLVAPRVYLSLEALKRTGLLSFGSQARYRSFYLSAGQGADLAKVIADQAPTLDRLRVERETPQDRSNSIGQTVENVNRFLVLIALAAIILGGVGVAAAQSIVLRQREADGAILRMLGASRATTTTLFLLLVGGISAISSAIGVAIGVGISQALPTVLASILPLTLIPILSPSAIATAFGVGCGYSIIFSLIALEPLLTISPLEILRPRAYRPWPWRAVILGTIAFGGLSGFLLHSALFGIVSTLVFITIIAAIFGATFLLFWVLRNFRLTAAHFTIRYGIRSLSRPASLSIMIIPALAITIAIPIATDQLSRAQLKQIELTAADNRSNQLLFDIQPDQLKDLEGEMQRQGLTDFSAVPIVTMKLTEIEGESVDVLSRQSDAPIPKWILRREFRSSYRAEPGPGEIVIRGRWFESSDSTRQVVPISLESGIATDMGVDVGSNIKLDVQGVILNCEVINIRKVEWRRLLPNFFILFPPGVLESAPQFYAVTGRTVSTAQTVSFQQAISARFPNISFIDLATLVESIREVFTKLEAILIFMTIFVAISGVAVMGAVLVNGAAARQRESALLKAIGASTTTIRRSLFAEFAMMGIVASTLGIGIGTALGSAVSCFYFKTASIFNLPLWGVTLVAIPPLAGFLALMFTRSYHRVSTLELLRTE